ncbi:uncharacterized protein LOC132195874 [Neocloeon triangulifer]|uniref:uncharacterized protein LOC132195874 n=1 Tax=Neocloeon triangulifer TaxID=2078957 RepID=UPI00286F8434|nr:uncharacterized protein LOC132195874 [Neocloeon triangulifer]
MASNSSTSLTSPNSLNNMKRQRSASPENVIVILPDESCFPYASPEVKKVKIRTEAKVVWTKEVTEAIINLYKENQEEIEKPDSNKSPVWQTIAETLNEQFGTTFSSENCCCKWKSLKNSYRKVEFSSRSDASKNKWAYYQVMHPLIKDLVQEPEPRGAYAAPTIVNDTPTLRTTAGSALQPTIKIITEPTAVLSTVNPTPAQEDLHYPMWFKQFYQVYRKNEETKIALLSKIKSSFNVMADRQCKALEKLNEHLSKLSG